MLSLRFFKHLLLLAGLPLIPVSPGRAADPVKMLKSKDYGYTARYPANWYPGSKRPDDPLDITDFPPSAAAHAVYIPRRGAEIMLASRAAFHLREAPQTIDAWITKDAIHASLISKRTFELGDTRTGISLIVEVRTEEGDAPLEAVNWYFDFHGKLFKAMLLYWQGNSSADNLIQVLRQIILSLKLSK